MPHDRDAIEAAKKKGAFKDNVFDPRALELSDDEKGKLKKDLDRVSDDLLKDDYPLPEKGGKKKSAARKKGVENLSFFEKIIVFFLSMVGIDAEEYKTNKAVHVIEKAVSKIKPPIYNASTKRVTKYFAYKIYDLYLKLFSLKKIYEKTVENTPVWNNPQRLQKSGVETLFEGLAGINSREVDERFSMQGIGKVISEYESVNLASESVDKAAHTYIDSIDKNSLEAINKSYTNIVYFKDLLGFDYVSFFKRFDPSFKSGAIPNFQDIYGDAIADYLCGLEESVLQLDLDIKNIQVFKKLDEAARVLDFTSETSDKADVDAEQVQFRDKTSEAGNPDKDKKLENDLVLLFENLKDILNKNYLTLLVRIIKKDPAYTPGFMRTKYDLFRIYSETFLARVRNAARENIKYKKRQKIEDNIHKSFNAIQFVGICNPVLSEKLEENGFVGFTYHYQVGVINTFLKAYYEEIIQGIINTVLMSGVFMDKHFQKNVSDTFYEMEKFQEKFKDLVKDIEQEGATAKKILSELARKDLTPVDQKKSVDRYIITVNGKAKDLYDQFYGLFAGITDILGKLFTEIEAKPPKYIRNIHTISGLKNARFLNYITNMANILGGVKESMGLLRD